MDTEGDGVKGPGDIDRLTAWELRTARAAADISAKALADLTKVSINTIRRAEADGAGVMSAVNHRVLKGALESLGVVFTRGDDGLRLIGFKAPSGSTPPA